MKNTYRKALEAKVVADFIKENNRSPNKLELKAAMLSATRQYPALEEVGFARHLVTKPQFASVSSASEENENRQAIYRDTSLANARIDELANLLENSFRGFHAVNRSMKRKLDQIESRLDNVLLLTGSTDAFVYGIEETFSVQDKIDFANTTASVEGGFCTIGRTGFGLVDLSDVHLTFSTSASKGYIGFQNTSPIDSLKSDDGTFWEHLVYTNYKQGRVNLIVDINLDDPQFISEVRFTANTGGINSRVRATVFYSFDGKTFKAVDPQETVLTTEENLFNIGLDDIKVVRLLLSKENFDNTTTINGQYVYLFSLDSIKLYSKSYTSDSESVLIAGPYEVFDEEGQEVTFTKATCDVCVASGEEQAVAVFLSADGVNYHAVDHGKDNLAIVTFANSAADGTEELLDDDFDGDTLVDTQFVQLRPAEALINKVVAADYANKVVRKSIVIKRNIPYTQIDGTVPTVNKAAAGWNYDAVKKVYKTTIYVGNPLGLSLDLGSTSAYINGIQRSGNVLLPEGYSTFETSEGNWQIVPAGIAKLESLRKQDGLYPYNHKYLVEGYVYSDTFQGEKVYAGVDEYFGTLLRHVPLELFSAPESNTDLGIYTVDDSTDQLIFKVKVNKSDANWSLEKYSTDWLVSRAVDNRIWLKMILNSSTQYNSPVVSSVKIRVL